MELGGLLRAFLLKDQLHIKPCPRCGLHYDQRQPACPHCGELDERGLEALRAERARQHEGNAAMGRLFLLIAALLGAFVLIGLLSL